MAAPASASLLRPALPDVLEEHLEEFGFLSLQRRKLLFSPDYPLRRLPAHDERIEAHLDGLRVGAASSRALAGERLASDEPWVVFAAARVWLELEDANATKVAERVASLDTEPFAGWREAVRQLPRERSKLWLPLDASLERSAPARALALEAAFWGGDADRVPLRGLERDPSKLVRRALARGLPRLSRGNEAFELARALAADPDPDTRRAALWSAARLDPHATLEHCRGVARGTDADPFAIRVLGLLGQRADHEVLVAASANPRCRMTAIRAFAELGTLESIESLLRLLALDDDEVREAAGAAAELVLGSISRAEHDAPPTREQALDQWARVREKHPRAQQICHGLPIPWSGDPAEEPLLWLWRTGHTTPRREATWLRHEVPDGFFLDAPVVWAIPGE